MTTRRTVTVIQEFMTSINPQMRKNAATALAALSSDEGDTLLVGVALRDADDAVRQHAVDTILSAAASRDNPSGPVNALRRVSGAEVHRQRAYAILGQIRALGIPVGRPNLRESFKLVRLIASLTTLPDFRVAQRFKWSLLPPAALGGLLGTFAFALFLTSALASPLQKDVLTIVLISCPIVAAALGVVATQRTIPIYLHFDPVAGAATGLLRVCLWSLGPAVVLGLIFAMSTDNTTMPQWLEGTIAVCALAVSVRAGTLIAFGISARTLAMRVAQVATGTAFGVLTVTLVTWLSLRLTGGVVGDEDAGAGRVWAMLVPAAVGLSNAFSSVDLSAPPRTRVAGLPQLALTYATIALFGGILALSYRPSLTSKGSRPFDHADLPMAPQGQARKEAVRFDSLPFEWPFQAEFAQEICVDQFRLAPEQNVDARIQPLKSDPQGILSMAPVRSGKGTDDGRPQVDSVLRMGMQLCLEVGQSGNYRVVLSKQKLALSLDDIYFAVLKTVRESRFGRPVAVDGNLVVTLNSRLDPPIELNPDEIARYKESAKNSFRWQLEALPATRSFILERGQRVSAWLPDIRRPDLDTLLDLLRDGKVTKAADDPPSLENVDLEPGRYELRARNYLRDADRKKTDQDSADGPGNGQPLSQPLPLRLVFEDAQLPSR